MSCLPSMLTFHPTLKPWNNHSPSSQSKQPKPGISVASSATLLIKWKRSIPTRISNAIHEGNSCQASHQTSAGKIKHPVLGPEGRTKLNPSPDRDFYSYPRFVTHVDEKFISTLTDLYRERLRPDMEVLDLMSSWVSHLPQEVEYKRVLGHGLNAQELARNPRFEYFFVKDLNQEQRLELGTCSLDAVLCTVSVQYLQQPEKVFAEVFRVLRPGGVFIVSFSNRMFYEKAIAAWREGTAYSRVQLVTQYFQCIEGFTKPEVVRKLPAVAGDQQSNSPFGWILRLMGLLSGADPFYALIAYKNFKPTYEER